MAVRYPWGIVFSANELFVADTGNHVVRRLFDNATVLFAGSYGLHGYQDGPLSAARFCNPTGVAIAKNRVLFVTDDRTVRMISFSTSWVTRVSGYEAKRTSENGLGTTVSIENPSFVAISLRNPTAFYVSESTAFHQIEMLPFKFSDVEKIQACAHTCNRSINSLVVDSAVIQKSRDTMRCVTMTVSCVAAIMLTFLCCRQLQLHREILQSNVVQCSLNQMRATILVPDIAATEHIDHVNILPPLTKISNWNGTVKLSRMN